MGFWIRALSRFHILQRDLDRPISGMSTQSNDVMRCEGEQSMIAPTLDTLLLVVHARTERANALLFRLEGVRQKRAAGGGDCEA